ncbi:arsenate reductase (glutaredoxin) [Crocinitomicaceae bacterium]|nr:arsenate reductase (glutaredoxin) [Crocinitomicaceae bacterium]
MKKIKIFHNNRCSKSRQALSLLNGLTSEVEVIDYMNTSVTKNELVQVLKELEMTPSELLRKGESDYKEHVKGNDLSDDQIIDLMLTYPKLIERPIVIKDGKAIIARPPELVHDFVGK